MNLRNFSSLSVIEGEMKTHLTFGLSLDSSSGNGFTREKNYYKFLVLCLNKYERINFLLYNLRTTTNARTNLNSVLY